MKTLVLLVVVLWVLDLQWLDVHANLIRVLSNQHSDNRAIKQTIKQHATQLETSSWSSHPIISHSSTISSSNQPSLRSSTGSSFSSSNEQPIVSTHQASSTKSISSLPVTSSAVPMSSAPIISSSTVSRSSTPSSASSVHTSSAKPSSTSPSTPSSTPISSSVRFSSLPPTVQSSSSARPNAASSSAMLSSSARFPTASFSSLPSVTSITGQPSSTAASSTGRTSSTGHKLSSSSSSIHISSSIGRSSGQTSQPITGSSSRGTSSSSSCTGGGVSSSRIRPQRSSSSSSVPRPDITQVYGCLNTGVTTSECPFGSFVLYLAGSNLELYQLSYMSIGGFLVCSPKSKFDMQTFICTASTIYFQPSIKYPVNLTYTNGMSVSMADAISFTSTFTLPVITSISGCSSTWSNPNVTTGCVVGVSPLTIQGLNFREDLVPTIYVNNTICAVDPRSRRGWPVCIVNSIANPPNFDYSKWQSVTMVYQGQGGLSKPFYGVMFNRPFRVSSSSSTARNWPPLPNDQSASQDMTLVEELSLATGLCVSAAVIVCLVTMYRRHRRRVELSSGVDERLLDRPIDRLIDRSAGGESVLYQPALATHRPERPHSPVSSIDLSISQPAHQSNNQSNDPPSDQAMYSSEEGQPHIGSFDAVQAHQQYLYGPLVRPIVRSWWRAPS